jgi:RNA recognition motif-containing protein
MPTLLTDLADGKNADHDHISLLREWAAEFEQKSPDTEDTTCPNLDLLGFFSEADSGADISTPLQAQGAFSLEEHEGIATSYPYESGTTTVMLRNIPNRVKTKVVLEKVCSHGFGESFDFFYMPLDINSKQNKGYAFINFPDETVARKFYESVNNTSFEGRTSSKKIHVCTAAAQGLHHNLVTISHTNWSKNTDMPLVRIGGKLMHMEPLLACEMLRSTSTDVAVRMPLDSRIYRIPDK